MKKNKDLSKVPIISENLLRSILNVSGISIVDYSKLIKKRRQTVYNRIALGNENIPPKEAKVIFEVIDIEVLGKAKEMI
ncbi:MAG: hypothetical protein NTW25_00990 [Candidatus Kapabacteria bacterium]|nr:hypothetical protein [Candidatus Kapabacteria bacterium]